MLSLITFKHPHLSRVVTIRLGVVLSLITFKQILDTLTQGEGLGVVLSLITFKHLLRFKEDWIGFGSSAIFNYF